MELNGWMAYRLRGERHILRQRLVAYAREHGIKAAAQAFGCTRNTLRTPLQIIQKRRPSLDPAIAAWRPLDRRALPHQYFPRYEPSQRGHDLPVSP